jgi:DNA-binding NtrC family response regulator
MLAASAGMLAVFDRVAGLGGSDAPALIEGESGVGKTQLARAVHQASAARRHGPLVVVCCAALPEALADSELFGLEMGVFARPGREVRPGAFERARGGTLLLRYVECLPAVTQAMLLRALDRGRITRVGGVQEIELDARVIATSAGLEWEAAAGAFRRDLQVRLAARPLYLPPLRQRPEDIPVLAAHFARSASGPAAEITPAAMDTLLRYPLARQRPGVAVRH